MILKDSEEKRPELALYKEGWPAHYYDIKDIDDREQILLEIMEEKPELIEESKRLEVLRLRYKEPTHKGIRKDFFMEGWMFLVIDTMNDFHFYNRKSLTKRLMKDYDELGIVPGKEPDAFLLEEWNDFAETLIRSNSSDKAYGSTAFGMVRMSDKNLSKKMADDIDKATLWVPEQLGIQDALVPFRKIMIQKYLDLVPNGSSYMSL